MKVIALANGGETTVDDQDYEYLSAYKWFRYDARSTSYARRYVSAKGEKHSIRMHRVIMGEPEGMVIDHINHNGLDNRRCNLRICTNSQNLRNRARATKRIYRGVSRHGRKWVARCWIEKKLVHLGLYPTPELAALAYNRAIIEVGLQDFAPLNEVSS